ncbi:MAG: PD40 domain-containing protein [Silvibacterium sp.]|nr:PD40 domain-containing protein [Silvibacterium sp.]
MESTLNSRKVVRFGSFELDANQGELRKNGMRVRLQGQPLQILLVLIESPGEVVTRDALRQKLWAETFVDFEHSLNTAVKKLRQALGDDPENPIFIETVPRSGYRFIAPVTRPGDGHPEGMASSDGAPPVPGNRAAAPTGPSSSSPTSLRFSVFRTRRAVAALILLLAAAGIGAFVLTRSTTSKRNESKAPAVLRIVPITTAPGDAIWPVFSPDDREIAFVWDGPERKHYDLYVQLVGAELPLRLTHTTSGELGLPAWSPDGRQVAFTRCFGENDGVYVVPALGGEEHELTSAHCLGYVSPAPLVWTADGADILLVDHCSQAGRFGVVDFSLATGAKRCLTDSAAKKGLDSGRGFAVSPNGKTLAFGQINGTLCCDLYAVPLAGGTPKRLAYAGLWGCIASGEDACNRIMWTPDGGSVVFTSSHAALFSLWRVSVDGGEPQHEMTYPAPGSLSKDGSRFVFSQRTSFDPPSIWQVHLANAGGPVTETKKVIHTQFPELDAQPSPDSARLVWMSIRTGNEEIWMSDADGRNQTQLTHLERYSGTPRWSPDARWIAFDSYMKTGTQIFAVDAEGRNLHQITSGNYQNVTPSWSRDGKSIYFASDRTGSRQIWKHSLDSGAEVQLTKQGGHGPMESYDGDTVYYTRDYEGGLWKVPSHGGAESRVIEGKPQVGFWGYSAVTRTGLYFLDAEAEPRPTIEFYSFTSGRISPVFKIDELPERYQPSLSASGDGKTIYFAQHDRQSVIKMMEFAPQNATGARRNE